MASPKIDPGYVIADKYRVVSHIGDGGMGQVYLVQHLQTDERFALKILNANVARTASARERFRREARTPARIDSDHVCRVVDTDIAHDLDAPFLVMEYLRGQNLQDLSDEIGGLAPREVLVYLRQIAIALDKAHAIGIVHRDLKPENLFLTTRDDGTPCVKVLDFGIAKLSGATGDLAKVKATQTGDVFGTPLFMSPEQCKSEGEKISAQSDIWALGLITHRLITGEDFWTANTLTHLIAQIAYEPIPAASERGVNLGPAYDAWFARCCAREPGDRFATASDAVRALQEALGLSPEITGQISAELVAAGVARAAMVSSPGRTSSPERRLRQTSEALTIDPIDSRQPRKSRALYVALGVGAVLVGGVAAWFLSVGAPTVDTPADPVVKAPAGSSESSAPSPPASAPTSPPATSAPPSHPSGTAPAPSSTTPTPKHSGPKGPFKPPVPQKGVDPLDTRT